MAKFEKVTETKVIGVNIYLPFEEFDDLYHIINNYKVGLEQEIREMIEKDEEVDYEMRHLDQVGHLLGQFKSTYYEQEEKK